MIMFQDFVNDFFPVIVARYMSPQKALKGFRNQVFFWFGGGESYYPEWFLLNVELLSSPHLHKKGSKTFTPVYSSPQKGKKKINNTGLTNYCIWTVTPEFFLGIWSPGYEQSQNDVAIRLKVELFLWAFSVLKGPITMQFF